jgi:hypothetical protein
LVADVVRITITITATTTKPIFVKSYCGVGNSGIEKTWTTTMMLSDVDPIETVRVMITVMATTTKPIFVKSYCGVEEKSGRHPPLEMATTMSAVGPTETVATIHPTEMVRISTVVTIRAIERARPMKPKDVSTIAIVSNSSNSSSNLTEVSEIETTKDGSTIIVSNSNNSNITENHLLLY